MNQYQLKKFREKWFSNHVPYRMLFYKDFKYEKVLNNCMNYKKRGKGKSGTYNDIIIAADTETSKSRPEPYDEPCYNIVVAWTISIRMFNRNIVTLYGHKPSQMIECINLITDSLNGQETYIYFHNLSYDYMFLRKFFFDAWGFPKRDLNTKPHNPLFITFQKENKLITFKDSLILAQRSLEKWAKDLNVKHQKATGSWDYDKIRTQTSMFSQEELKYIEHDTLALCECIDKTLEALNKSIYSIPYTSTGIIRHDIQEIALKNRGHDRFLNIALDFDQLLKMFKVFHGGFTHGNRFIIDQIIYMLEQSIRCFDFASSYPFCICACKFPMGKFIKFKDVNSQFIIDNEHKYAFMFRLSLINVRLRDPLNPMPCLQESKTITSINLKVDNGRIIQAGYCSLYLTEQDLIVIKKYYTWDNEDQIDCTEVEVSRKDYLPRWFTDYVFSKFEAKTRLKGGDPVLYSLEKSKANGCYGMTVQKPITDDHKENYITGEFVTGIPRKEEETDEEYDKRCYDENKAKYEKYVKKKNSVLPYQWGVWVTAYAFKHLHELGECINEITFINGKMRAPKRWLYSDTDSIYSDDWNYEKIETYNQRCKDMLRANGYGPVIHNGREYWLGVAESKDLEDEYSEFKVLGSKRYCGRSLEDNKLHITVAGVPKKKGAACLKDDISNFTKDFIFPGSETGKLTHFYIYQEDIFIDNEGNEVGDSIDLKPCDYLLDPTDKWSYVEEDEYYIRTYTEDEVI